MYVMMCTRPNIYYAVEMASRYQSNPSQAHWKVVKRMLRCLNGTTNYSLCYQGKDLRMKCYNNAD